MAAFKNDLDKLLDQLAEGVALESTPEFEELAKKAVEARKNDTRTDQEIIEDGIDFIMNTDFGGP